VLTHTRPASPAGTAYLKFVLGARTQTVLARSFATSPMKIFATRNPGMACWAYGATLGGGLVGGDELRMDVDVAEGARALVTTQASTKVYRSVRPSTQTLCATVGGGALLAVLPDPIVCYAGADFAQHQHYDLHADASIVAVDWMTSGRQASGECWAFSRYRSRIRITRDRRPILHDAIALERDLDSVSDRMSGFTVFLTAVLTGPMISTAATSIFEEVSARHIIRGADFICSASPIADDGVLLRMAGSSVEQVGRSLRDALRPLYPLLGDDPWSRKW
jgi:urease accessory protein